MKKGFFKWGRNPFKIWQSYIGLLLVLLLPSPLFTFFRGEYITVLEGVTLFWDNATTPLVSIIYLPLFLMGFFFGASLKKGKDNFFQYGLTFLVIELMLDVFLISSFRGM